MVETAPIPSLERELSQLSEAARLIGRNTVETMHMESMIQESILGISLYFKQLIGSHAIEVSQLRDEIQILHKMMQGRNREASNLWRQQLERRAEIETKIRSTLDRGAVCVTVCVPIPSPLMQVMQRNEATAASHLAQRSGANPLDLFLSRLNSERENDVVGVWTSDLAVIWRSDPQPAGHNQATLPELACIDDSNYCIRARAWEVISEPGEHPEAYLKRIGGRERIGPREPIGKSEPITNRGRLSQNGR